jgi:hypothetical protein
MLSIPVEHAAFLNKHLIGTPYRFFAAHSGVSAINLTQRSLEFVRVVIYLTVGPLESEQPGRKFERQR